jgi:zinc transport system permease protein
MVSDFLTTLTEMFSYTFIVRAFIVGALVSICAALLGVSLVLKRYSMIGDGLSHVGFGTLALATALNVAPLTVSIPVVIAAAFLLLRLSENSKIKGDAAIALISTGSLAIGVVIISQTTGMNTDVCNYLFGSILAMSKSDVHLSIVLSATVLTLFIVFYNKLFAITFDETFAKATGVKTGVYNMLIAFLTAITIVLGMRMMGAMLISSLIIFPALTSMRLLKKFKSVTLCSAILSIVCFFIGVVISYIYATPTGASVVMINIAAFLLFWGISALTKEQKAMKKVSIVSLGVSCIAIISLLGCGKPKTVSPGDNPPQSNTADTLSLTLPADVSESESIPVKATGENTAVEKKEKMFVAQGTKDSALVEIREKMFIAQVNDVYLNPEDYLGKTIKLEGLFKAEEYFNKESPLCFVVRYGPGCCGNDGNAGFEVAWNNETAANRTYPKDDDWVEVVGTLQSYEEEGYPYLYLALSGLTVLDKRGAEFVTQ